MKRRAFLIASATAVALAGCEADVEAKGRVQVYKQPTCGCCGGWAEHMERHGYTVETHNVSDLNPTKQKYGIPRPLETCHTAVVDGYVIEGHVPAPVVDRLLAERPEIDGIGLPRMPAGSPGMPGEKQGIWTIYAIKDGQYFVYEKL